MRSRVLGVAISLCATFLAAPAAWAQAPAPNPERDAYFGETHVHTSWSLDAFALRQPLTDPADAYKYFKGEPIKHPLGYDVKIDTPLDWAGVTDHSEYVGVIKLANEPGSPVSKLPAAQPLILKAEDQGRDAAGRALRHQHADRRTAGQGADVARDRRHGVEARTSTLAEPGQRAGEVHGVLLLRVDLDAEQHEPAPQRLLQGLRARCRRCRSARWTRRIPVDLWDWMDGQRKAGNELLAISHNANLSDGRMFPTEVDIKGRPIDAAYAASRVRNEPLIEIKQIKGTSETHPLLSPNDEFASFEIMSVLLGDPPGRIPHIVGSYARQALKDGLAMQDTQGLQPVQVRLRRRVRLAQHRRPLPPGQLLRRPCVHRRHDRGAHVRAASSAACSTRALESTGRADRRVGRGEHARLAVRGHAAQGDVRRQRPAHQGAPVRRLGVHRGRCWPTPTG